MNDRLPAGVRGVKRRVARHFDQVAGQYDEREGIFSAPVAARLIQEAGVRPGDRVLDVGCGTGAALLPAAVAVLPGGDAVGIDLSQGMLASALFRAGDAGLRNVRLFIGDAEDPPDPPCAEASFDKVIASLVISLLPHPEEAARRWLRLLRPGGLLVFSWQIAQDPGEAATLDAAGTYTLSGFPKLSQMLRRRPLTSVREMENMLAGCGYTQITTVAGDLPMRYPSPAAWWESGRSHDRRVSRPCMPKGRRHAAKAEVLGVPGGPRAQDGSVTRAARYGWTTACRPPEPDAAR